MKKATVKNQSKKTNLLHEARLVDGKRVEVKDAETYTEATKVLHDIFLLNVQLLQLVRLK